MLRKIHRQLRTVRPESIVVLSLVGMVIVGWVDARTGPAIDMAVFYLPSIAAVAWYVGSRTGIVFALLATIASTATAWATANPHPDSKVVILNAGARLLFFLFASGMISVVARQNASFSNLAREDPLTGIPNRRAFFEELDRALEWGRRYDTPIVLAYIDVDDFKLINDGDGGHAEGDTVLVTVARALREGTRKVDLVARLGGDEFALLLPGTDAKQAERVIDHVLTLVRQRLAQELNGRRVTMSVGVVAFAVPPSTPDTALALADASMYTVKQQGKNRVSFRTWP
jgi:diguanylate cyclase (GGDEF)-like protein